MRFKLFLFILLIFLNNCSDKSIVYFNKDNEMEITINNSHIEIDKDDYFYYLSSADNRNNIMKIEDFITINDKTLWYIVGSLGIDSRKKEDAANKILKFINSMNYIGDGKVEYIKYPFETIVDYGGDCEDTSILFMTLAKIIGLDVYFLRMPKHIMVVLNGDFQGYYIMHNNKKYYTVETAVKNIDIGKIYVHAKKINEKIENSNLEEIFNIYLINDYKLIPVEIKKDK